MEGGGRRPADAHWMRRALTLARRRAGHTWPNPSVGACLVRNGRLLAEGVHEGAGQPHAEVVALERARRASVDVHGATLYVSLEPCHHTGRTPPCSRAIHAAGLERVVYALADDNPRHAGGGAAWLREQGVVVEGGLLAPVAAELNHPFFETRRDDEVHWTLKLALSLDGRLARAAGPAPDPASRRITGEAAHRRVHALRARASAILVGRRTAAFDRPRLDLRHLPPPLRPPDPPRPVILDPRLRLDPTGLPARSLVLHAPRVSSARWAGSGHELEAVEESSPGRLDLDGIEAALARRGLGVVLVEGGATLAEQLLAAARPHRVHLFLAPRLLGGEGPTLPPVAVLGERYRTLRVARVGQDVQWILRREDLPPGRSR